MGEEPDFIEPAVDMGMVQSLQQNGVPEMAAKHAVHNTNGSSVDDAVMWFYSNIENPAINEPLLIPNPKKGASGAAGGEPDMIEPEVDSSMVSQLV